MGNFRKETYKTWQEASEVVKKFNLKQGDEISIFEKDNGLFVSSEKKDYEKKTACAAVVVSLFI